MATVFSVQGVHAILIDIHGVLTAPAITAAYLAEHHPGARCLLLNSGDIGEDLAGVTVVDDDDPEPDVVVIGGAGAEGLQLDAGAFLLGLDEPPRLSRQRWSASPKTRSSPPPSRHSRSARPRR
jgi:hypothetical protein